MSDKAKKTDKDTSKTTNRTRKELSGLRKLAAKTPGLYQAIAERLTKKTGETQYRANVREWLDGVKEPRLGLGLYLLDVSDDLETGAWDPLKK